MMQMCSCQAACPHAGLPGVHACLTCVHACTHCTHCLLTTATASSISNASPRPRPPPCREVDLPVDPAPAVTMRRQVSMMVPAEIAADVADGAAAAAAAACVATSTPAASADALAKRNRASKSHGRRWRGLAIGRHESDKVTRDVRRVATGAADSEGSDHELARHAEMAPNVVATCRRVAARRRAAIASDVALVGNPRVRLPQARIGGAGCCWLRVDLLGPDP
eukprot:364585-Chlamydomonas_euryale.AAC.12